MAATMCVVGTLGKKEDALRYPDAHPKCFDAGKGMCRYVDVVPGELGHIFQRKNNVSLVFEDETTCMRKVQMGEYDYYLEINPYTRSRVNVTQGAYLFERDMSILTSGLSNNSTHYADQNLVVYQINVYWVLFAFIAILSILNVTATLMKSARRRLDFSHLVKLLAKNMFNLTSGHFGVIKHHSSIRMLQLALLLSVTLTVTVYSAVLCRGRTSIFSPKAHESYKSLVDDPLDAIVVFGVGYDILKNGWSGPGSKKYLSQAKEKFIDIRELFPNYRRKGIRRVKHAALASGQIDVACLSSTLLFVGMHETEIFTIQRNDPDPLKLISQVTLGNSVLAKPGGEKLVKTARIAMEQHLAIPAWQLVTRKYVRLFSTYKRAYISNGFPPDKSLNKYKNLTLASLKPLFFLCKWLFVFAFIQLAYEMVVFSQMATVFKERVKYRPKRRERLNKVRPRTA